MKTTPRLPFFVYGTLRTGEPNWSWALQGRTLHEEPATFTGGYMYDQGGFPYVVRAADPTATITGDLAHVDDSIYPDVLADLDRLEGYRPGERGFYDRQIVTAATRDGRDTQAYIYVIADPDGIARVRSLPFIKSGDWVQHLNTRRTHLARLY